MKRKIVFVVMFVLAVLMVSANGKQEKAAGNQGSTEKKETSLRIKCVSWIAKKGFVTQAVNDFKAENPDIDVSLELIDEVNSQTQSIMWASGKTDCDLFVGIDPSVAPNFVGRDYIYTMEELKFWDKYSKDNLVSGPLNECTFGSGTRYVPLMAEFMWFSVNTDHLKQAGIMKDDTVPVPESWDQINEWARMLKDKFGRPEMAMNIAPGAYIVDNYDGGVQALLGKNRFEADGTTLVTDAPEIRNMLKAWKTAWDENLMIKSALTDGGAGRAAYAAGKVALNCGSNSRWVGKEKDIGMGKTAPMALPGGLENGSLMWISAMSIPRAAASPNLAQKFAIYLLQDKYQRAMMTTYGKMAATRSAYKGTGSKFTSMGTALEKSTPNPMYKDFDVYYDKLGDLLQNYLTGKIDLDSCINGNTALIKSIDKTIVQ